MQICVYFSVSRSAFMKNGMLKLKLAPVEG